MKVLFVHHRFNSTFIKNDLEILKKHYEVIDFYFTVKKIPQLIKAIKNTDIIYVWFISYPAYLIGLINRFYRKPIVLVAGGYGVQSELLKKHKIFKLMVKSATKRAYKILAVSKFTGNEVLKLEPKGYAYKYKTEIVYNGIDLTKFSDHGIRDNNKSVIITVGIINTWKRYFIKGIDKFIGYAKETPNANFYVIGMTEKMGEKIYKKLKDLPMNLYFYLPVTQQELVYFYNVADVYCQFSRYESFCLALLEAKVCGCTCFLPTGTGMDEIMDAKNPKKEFSLAHRERRLVGILDGYRN